MYMVKQYQFLKADKDRIDQCCVVYIVDIGVSTIQQKSRWTKNIEYRQYC